MKNVNSIQDETKIQKAIMDTFFTFDLFDNISGNLDKKYFNMIKKLANSDLLINSFNEEKGVNFQQKFDNELERRRLLYEQGDAPSRIREDFITSAGDDFVFNGFENLPNITQEDKTIDLLEFSQERALHQYVRMLENEEKYTGTNILDIKNVFLLFPIKVRTLSDEIIYIDIYFTLFKHGYGIVDASFRINDKKIEQLSTDIWDVGIKAAYLPNFMVASEKKEKYLYKKISRCNTVDIVIERYIEVLKKMLSIKSDYMFKYETLTILKMDKQPYNFDNENISLYKEIFKLLFAPTNLSISSKKAKERLEKNSKLPNRNSKIFLNSKRFILVYGTDIYNELNDFPIKSI